MAPLRVIDPTKPFWREAPLTDAEWKLLVSLMEAHAISAQRDNVSTHAVIGSAVGSGNYLMAMASPLLTLGSLHGPIQQAMDLLSCDDPWAATNRALMAGKKVPGFGGSFQGGDLDPAWVDFMRQLSRIGPKIYAEARNIHHVLQSWRKNIQPNPALFTAAAALVLGIPKQIAPYLFIAGRLEVWSAYFLQHTSSNQLWDSQQQQLSQQ